MQDIFTPLSTCERVLDALRSYDERDAAIGAPEAEVESARARLLATLYGRTVADDQISRQGNRTPEASA